MAVFFLLMSVISFMSQEDDKAIKDIVISFIIIIVTLLISNYV